MFAARNMTFAGAFSPLSLSPALWLSDTGADAAQWDDLSGNGRHATQAVGANQPAIISAALNGRQVRRFDGVDDFMRGSPLWSGADPCSVFVVYLPRTTGGINTLFGQSVTATASTWRHLQHRVTFAVGDPYFAGFADDATDGTTPTTAAKIGAFAYNGTTLKLYRNATEIFSAAKSLNTTSGDYWIGSDVTGAYANSDIAEILAYPTALSDGDRIKVQNYLNNKYAIY